MRIIRNGNQLEIRIGFPNLGNQLPPDKAGGLFLTQIGWKQ
jgi:hypothetical protein